MHISYWVSGLFLFLQIAILCRCTGPYWCFWILWMNCQVGCSDLQSLLILELGPCFRNFYFQCKTELFSLQEESLCTFCIISSKNTKNILFWVHSFLWFILGMHVSLHFSISLVFSPTFCWKAVDKFVLWPITLHFSSIKLLNRMYCLHRCDFCFPICFRVKHSPAILYTYFLRNCPT